MLNKFSKIVFSDNLKEKLLIIENEDAYFICDKNTYKFLPIEPKKLLIINSDKEEIKTQFYLIQILDFFYKNSVRRNSIVVCFGGGTLSDLVGFASSIYLRGINFIIVPTTLLAMVDASIGGKTGINYNGTKNLIGSFYYPKEIIINTDVLNFLSENDYFSSIGEIIKYSLITKNKIFFKYLIDNVNLFYKKDAVFILKIIKESIKIKKSYVLKDPFDNKNIRVNLNLGHTFAHALESLYDFSISHGKAVGIGIYWSLCLSYKLKLCSRKFFNMTINILNQYSIMDNLVVVKDDNFELFYSFLLKDKKNSSEKISFILLKNFGKTIKRDVEKNLIKMVLKNEIF